MQCLCSTNLSRPIRCPRKGRQNVTLSSVSFSCAFFQRFPTSLFPRIPSLLCSSLSTYKTRSSILRSSQVFKAHRSSLTSFVECLNSFKLQGRQKSLPRISLPEILNRNPPEHIVLYFFPCQTTSMLPACPSENSNFHRL